MHDGTEVQATWDWNKKLSRIGLIKGNTWHFKQDIEKIFIYLSMLFCQYPLRNIIYYPLFGQFLVPVPGIRNWSSSCTEAFITHKLTFGNQSFGWKRCISECIPSEPFSVGQFSLLYNSEPNAFGQVPKLHLGGVYWFKIWDTF